MILVVDDDAQFLEVALIALSPAHAGGILLAENGHRALHLLKLLGNEICMVLVDLLLPDMNGFELIKSIRASAPDLMVIAVSAYRTDEVLKSAILFGATHVMPKPISSPEWKPIVNWVRTAQNEKKARASGESDPPA